MRWNQDLVKWQEKFLHLCRKLYHPISVLVLSKGPLLTGVAGLQSTGCNVTKNELLTKFLKDILKISGNVQEELCNGVPF